jgi:hypothetical protein
MRAWGAVSSPLVRLAIVYALVFAGLRVTIAAPDSCGTVTSAQTKAAARAGADWIARNQRLDGSFLYEYSSKTGVIPGYDTVRHAGAVLALYNAATFDRRFLAPGDRGTRYVINRLVTVDDGLALPDGSEAPLGGDALMLAALAQRRVVTHSPAYDATMRALGRFILASQRRDGGFNVGYDLQKRTFNTFETSPYYPGEATWALARLANAFPNEPEWRRAAVAAGNYIATKRDDVEDIRFPPINDHWASYAYAEMASWPNSPAVIGYARRLYGRFDLLIHSQSQRDRGAVARLTHGPYRRGAALGTWVEGQAALERLARTDHRLEKQRGDIQRSMECGASVLLHRQSHGRDPRIAGAWFAHGETRVDDQQHPVSSLVAATPLLSRQP